MVGIAKLIGHGPDAGKMEHIIDIGPLPGLNPLGMR